jgi:hypothetical protein
MFTPAASPVEPRSHHTATALPDGRVLVVGGWSRSASPASAVIWDPATETFGPTGSPAEERSRHTATLLIDGRVLVVGGWDLDAVVRDKDPLPSAEVWVPGDR